MPIERVSNIENFLFRNLHPNISIGTASDRYAGWIGQIYTEKLYKEKIETRSKKIGDILEGRAAVTS